MSMLFYCGTLPALYTVDQRRILFYKKLKHHSSILIRTIARLCQHGILSVAAKYGINRLENSVSSIKKSIWQTFAASVVLAFSVFIKVFYCKYQMMFGLTLRFLSFAFYSYFICVFVVKKSSFVLF